MSRIQEYYRNGPYSQFVKEFRTAGTNPINVIRLSQPAGEFPDPPAPAFNLFMITKGVVQTRIDLGAGWFTRVQGPGSFVVAPPNTACDYKVDGPHELIVVSMPSGVVGKLFHDLSSSTNNLAALHADAFQHPLIEQLCCQLLEEASEDNPQGDLFADHALVLLIRVLTKLAGEPLRDKPLRGRSISGFPLSRVLDYIHDHLADRISLEALAEIAGVSRFHFARQFQQAMGISPHQYVIQQRTERAKELIARGNLNLAQIAAKLGFSDQSHFGKYFKRHVGMTPRAFAKRTE